MADSNCFPRNKKEALSILYLQQQDISKLTPKELLGKYEETYKLICDATPSPTIGTSNARIIKT